MSIFENMRQLNKLSNDTKLIEIELLLLKIYKNKYVFYLITFFIFYNIFCPISQNKSGRHKVPFVVMCHK